jgi:hypothetical protein
MYNPIDEFAKAHQQDLLAEARTERSLAFLRADRPGLRDRVLIAVGNWMIALGHRLHNATHCQCAANQFSENRV